MPFLRKLFGGGGGGLSPCWVFGGVGRGVDLVSESGGRRTGVLAILSLAFFRALGGFSRPSGLYSFTRNGRTSRGGQRSGAGLSALGGYKLTQGDRSRVAGVWRFGGPLDLSGRLLNDLEGEGVRIAGPFRSCSGRHTPIVARPPERKGKVSF